ncbi:sigma-70 family RNA polymerase sigma factor [Cellulomonas composti]|uniref:RNA polymerase sigma-70 region 2 domain-containing protein n=1 Tax=Cellulomonas composti TaxID=266130 RepID=A0A511J7M2_9CELL|nr:sigma-70 family RNA polymerase sigma factor [Cellulomonas composti]GEL93991.1 hypothetical protein CCO02nite_06490 [Cellulomonas composti]
MTAHTDVEDVVRSDAELIASARAGDPAGFAGLYERHAGAALVVARRYVDGDADAEDVVADSFTAVYGALGRGHGPDEAFRAYLFTVVRRVAAVRREGARRARPTDDVAELEAGTALAGTAEEPALAGFERGVVARAFHSLPQRWQAVLWHTEVEGLTPAEIAPILGLTANGVAALSYRAREGLRQAYLQQHLQDPLEQECRAFAGQLGSYVRGGLSARDTTKVEAHLDGCGDCRALVLELGDVNHGMRAVVAPLVLGLVGVGALSHALPVGGGLAAAGAWGAAAGGAGGAGGATLGQLGKEAGAGGAGGGAAAGAAAAGGAAGSSAASSVGGVAAFLASIPAGVVGVLAGTIVVAAVAVAVVTGLRSGSDDPDLGPVAATSSPSATTPGGEPSSSADPSAGPLPTNDPGDPTQGPTNAPIFDPGPGSDPSADPTSRPTAGPTAGPTAEPTSEPTTEPTTEPTSEPTTEPTIEPTVEPTIEPTVEPTVEPTTPPPAPADVSVELPSDGLALDAGSAGQELALTLRNSGDEPARSLVAELTTPTGVTVDSLTTGMSRAATAWGFLAADPGWSCTVADSQHARCTLDALPGGATSRLSVRVSIDESFDASGADVQLSVVGEDIDYQPEPIEVVVRPAPARIALAADQQVPTLVAGRPVTATIALRNAGGLPASAPTATVHLPAGVLWAGGETGDWTCATPPGDQVGVVGPQAEGADVTCARGELAARATAPLALTLVAPDPGELGSAELTVDVTPAGGRPALVVPFDVLRPARMTVTSPDSTLTVAGGRTSSLQLVVANDGDLSAQAANLDVTLPVGVTWTGAVGDGWACGVPVEEAREPLVRIQASDRLWCTGPELEPGATSSLVVSVTVDAGATGDLGDLVVRASARDADAGEHLALPVTGLAPVLALQNAGVALQADDTGQIAFAVAAAAPPEADAAKVRATVELPANLVADVKSAAWPSACVASGSESLRTVVCSWPVLAAGEVVEVLLPVRSQYVVPGAVEISATAAGVAEPVTTSAPVPGRSGGLATRFSTPAGSGWDVTEAGAPLLTCKAGTTTCTQALAGGADNNSQTMVALDEAPPEGPRASVPVSSSTKVSVPADRKIVFAGLYWSANRGAKDTWSGPTDVVLLRGPGAAYVPVTATGEPTTRTDSSDRLYYSSFADVTALVTKLGPGEWSVADAAVSAKRTDSDPTYYAGWSLVVVYSAPGDAQVTIYDGGLWVGTSAPPPAFHFAAPAGSLARFGVVGWEGDRGLTGDRLRLAGACTDATTDLTPLRGDGTTGSAANAFDSSATGWRWASSLGVDAKGFVPTRLPCDVDALTPMTTGDQYFVGAVTLRTQPAQER